MGGEAKTEPAVGDVCDRHVEGWEVVSALTLTFKANDFAWSPKGDRIAVLDTSQTKSPKIHFFDFDLASFTFLPDPLEASDSLSGPVDSIAWQPVKPGYIVAFATGGDIVLTLDPKEKMRVVSQRVAPSPISSVVWSPKGKYLAIILTRNTLGTKAPLMHVWEMNNKDAWTVHVAFTAAMVGDPSEPTIACVSWDPFETQIFCGFVDYSSTMINVAKKKCVPTYYQSPAVRTLWSPDGRQAISIAKGEIRCGKVEPLYSGVLGNSISSGRRIGNKGSGSEDSKSVDDGDESETKEEKKEKGKKSGNRAARRKLSANDDDDDDDDAVGDDTVIISADDADDEGAADGYDDGDDDGDVGDDGGGDYEGDDGGGDGGDADDDGISAADLF